jgi:hypothetical protein
VTYREKRLKVRLRSDEYFLDEEGRFQSNRMYGNIMHLIFSRIIHVSDVEQVISSFYRQGVLPGSDRERINLQIQNMISQPEVATWFSDNSWTIYNERSMLCGGGKILRPDRVMIKGNQVIVIDFKFGEAEKAYYLEQVAAYMHQMVKLGYDHVAGYVWYVNLGKTIQITEI